jgi:hypothetical protein
MFGVAKRVSVEHRQGQFLPNMRTSTAEVGRHARSVAGVSTAIARSSDIKRIFGLRMIRDLVQRLNY